ncbi:MAG: 5'/3'-nucleotidase SurE [Sandaracinus sp.]
MDRPLIVLSNDDGVHAEGIRALHHALSKLADVVVVAPLHEQSANSHSLTLARPLRHRVIDDFHAVDGTPADCIYVALYGRRFLSRTPDAVVSGINHGYNLGSDTFYSGTVAAAREGALRGIPSIAFSLGMGRVETTQAREGGERPSMAALAPIAAALAMRLVEATRGNPHQGGTPLLNVNFPAGFPSPRGIRATRLGRRRYTDEVEVREDPRGREYLWIGGPNAFHDPAPGSDTEAVDEGWISVTPLALDATSGAHAALAQIVAAELPARTEETR